MKRHVGPALLAAMAIGLKFAGFHIILASAAAVLAIMLVVVAEAN